MKKALVFIIIFSASPAFAHHEVVVATSMLPMWFALAAISGGAFAAWKRGREIARNRRENR